MSASALCGNLPDQAFQVTDLEIEIDRRANLPGLASPLARHGMRIGQSPDQCLDMMIANHDLHDDPPTLIHNEAGAHAARPVTRSDQANRGNRT